MGNTPVVVRSGFIGGETKDLVVVLDRHVVHALGFIDVPSAIIGLDESRVEPDRLVERLDRFVVILLLQKSDAPMEEIIFVEHGLLPSYCTVWWARRLMDHVFNDPGVLPNRCGSS